MRAGSVLLIIFWLPILVNSCYTAQNMELIASLLQHLNVKSCILVGTWCSYIPERIKFLSERKIYAVYFSLDRLVEHLKEMQIFQRNPKVSIILKIDEELEVERVLWYLKAQGSYLQSVVKFNWIVLIPQTTKKLASETFYVPFDSHFMLLEEHNETYKISEIYQFRNESKIVYSTLGYWGEEKINDLVQIDFFQRRRNFRKENLTVIVQDEGTYTLAEQINLEFWLDLANLHNITTNGIEEKDFDSNVIKQDLLVHIAVMHYLHNATQNIIAPLMIAKWHMYIRSSEDFVSNWMAYLKPFNIKLWYGVSAALLVSTSITITIGWVGKKILKFKKYTLFEQAMVPLSAFCNQSCAEEPDIISARIAKMFIFATTSVIIPAYSAAIISFLMVYTPHIPFTDLNSFVQDGTYKLAAYKELFAKFYFDLTPRKAERTIRDHYLLPYDDFPPTHEAAIEMVCSYDKMSVLNFNYRMFDHPSPCRLLIVSKSIVNILTGLETFNHGAHYTRTFRNSLVTFREAGIVDRWHTSYYSKRNKRIDDVVKPLGIMKVIPLLFNVLIGVAFSSLLLTAEILHDYYKFTRRSQRLFTIPKIEIMRSQSDAFKMFVEDVNYFNSRKSIVVEYY